jgi:hypothetical protein
MVINPMLGSFEIQSVLLTNTDDNMPQSAFHSLAR